MDNKKTLDIIINGISKSENLLYLFSSYVSSDANFKYNQTYLTDQIESFFFDYGIFEKKRDVFNEIIKYIKNISSNNLKIEILLDETFYYSNIDNNERYIINFALLKKNEFVLKLTLNSPLIEYSHIVKSNIQGEFEWKTLVNNFINIANSKIIIDNLNDEE